MISHTVGTVKLSYSIWLYPLQLPEEQGGLFGRCGGGMGGGETVPGVIFEARLILPHVDLRLGDGGGLPGTNFLNCRDVTDDESRGSESRNQSKSIHRLLDVVPQLLFRVPMSRLTKLIKLKPLIATIWKLISKTKINFFVVSNFGTLSC